MNWLMPSRNSVSACPLMSKGVARNGAWYSHVNVSELVTGFPSRWLAEAAYLVERNDRQFPFPPASPSGRSANAYENKAAGGEPYPWMRNRVLYFLASAVNFALKLSLKRSVTVCA